MANFRSQHDVENLTEDRQLEREKKTQSKPSRGVVVMSYVLNSSQREGREKLVDPVIVKFEGALHIKEIM